MAKQEVITLLKEYISLLKSEGVGVNNAYLFGSYSNDTATEDSDIDVLIVSDNYDENDDAVIGKIWKLTRKINNKIEPFLIGVRRYSDKNSHFINLIKANGIKIT